MYEYVFPFLFFYQLKNALNKINLIKWRKFLIKVFNKCPGFKTVRFD